MRFQERETSLGVSSRLTLPCPPRRRIRGGMFVSWSSGRFGERRLQFVSFVWRILKRERCGGVA